MIRINSIPQGPAAILVANADAQLARVSQVRGAPIEGRWALVAHTELGFDLNTLSADRKNEIVRSYIVAGGEVIKGMEVDLGPR